MKCYCGGDLSAKYGLISSYSNLTYANHFQVAVVADCTSCHSQRKIKKEQKFSNKLSSDHVKKKLGVNYIEVKKLR